MRTITVLDTPFLVRSTPHNARSFAELPDADAAVRLLDEIAGAPCPFAPVPMDRPLALYGAGSLGRLAREFLTSVGHHFALVVDLNAAELARDPYWSGVELRHPDAVSQADKHTFRLAVSIVTSPYVPIERSLRERGFEDVVPFYDVAESFRQVHPLSNGWFAAPLSKDDQNRTATVLEGWADDVSRAHHLQFLAWRRLREEWTFAGAPVPNCPRFFIPEVTDVLRDDEIVLDAGAHHGGVTEAFIRQTKSLFSRIVAIEPDPINRRQLAANLQARMPGDPRIGILDCALGAEEADATFHSGLDYASQLSSTGAMRVKARPLDGFGIAPSFLKLHLEGAELAALKGGRQMLRSSRPLIAATVYHNADGIWRTPLWLMRTLPDYRFLFRAHSWCGTGAVVYAIPNERYDVRSRPIAI
jgi:FkbM family methyltransferase